MTLGEPRKQGLIYLEPDVLSDGSRQRAAKDLRRIAAIGDTNLLVKEKLALYCSAKCPGRLILRTYDLAQRLRTSGLATISGFHTPMEKACLSILLRGPAPVIVCPARSIEVMKLPSDWARPVEEGRLMVLSPFDAKETRITKETAELRNEFVAAVADRIFVAHAAPGGRTEALCRQVIASGRPLLTLDCVENENLFALGATPFVLKTA
jgi:predicted Rossmann fold nucleotide-binding protein DprA/Smf involved in DNA uptake